METFVGLLAFAAMVHLIVTAIRVVGSGRGGSPTPPANPPSGLPPGGEQRLTDRAADAAFIDGVVFARHFLDGDGGDDPGAAAGSDEDFWTDDDSEGSDDW